MKKAWATRRKNKTLKITALSKSLSVGDRLTLENYTENLATEALTPYEQLDAVLTQLENRILNTVARIKSLGI